MKINAKKLHPNAKLPVKAHKTDAGFDLFAVLDEFDTVIKPGERRKVKTGIAIDVPDGWEAEIRGRSGLDSNTGLIIANGTVDAGYQGEISITVKNTNMENDGSVVVISDKQSLKNNAENYKASYLIKNGDRIAQLLFHKVPDITLTEVDDFSETSERGANGFGSTGV